MNKRSILFACLTAMLAFSSNAVAQDEPATSEEPAAPEAEGAEGAEGEPAAAPAAEGAEAAEGEPAASEGSTAGEGADVGPGNRPLRKDYPGTPESKQANMETARLGGAAADGDSQTYDLRVRELETRIDDLKDRVFRSKSRIILLRETLIGGKLAGSAAVIRHRNDMGDAFRLVQAVYTLDSKPIFNESNLEKGVNPGKKTFDILSGPLSPSNHFLEVKLVYRGDSSVLPYFSNYDITLRKRCTFEVNQGLATVVDVVSYEVDDITVSVEDKPRLKCDIQTKSIDALSKDKGDK